MISNRERVFTILLWTLLIGGAILSAGSSAWFLHSVAEPLSSVGEAFFVAGVLGLTVDKYVKEKLSRDVSRNVMEATLGHHLPKELHSELESITRYKVVRRNFKIRYHLTPQKDNMWLESAIDFEVENLTDEPQIFTHRIWVQKPFGYKGELDQILLAKCMDPESGTVRYDHNAEELRKRVRQVPGNAIEWVQDVSIAPGRQVRFWSVTRQMFPPEHVDIFIFTDPTIGAEVSVTCPDTHAVEVLMLHRLEAQVVKSPTKTWELRTAAFLPNTGISVEWRMSEQPASAVSPPPPAVTPTVEQQSGGSG